MSDFVLALKVTADGQLAVANLKELGEQLKGIGDQSKKSNDQQQGLTGAVAKGTAAVEIALRSWDKYKEKFHEWLDLAREAQLSHLRLEAILHATAGAAGQSADAIDKFAEKMAHTTIFNDDQVRNAAAQLLTFKEITGDTFNEILKLSADLASTGRGDLQTWVTILAKAGTEPAETIGLLERQLGKFRPALKVAIQDAADFNDQQRATSLLLDEVRSRVGGTAEDTYRGLNRQIEGTKKAFDDLGKSLAERIFDAHSRDASILEQQIRRLDEAVKESSWLRKLFAAMTGDMSAFGGEAGRTNGPRTITIPPINQTAPWAQNGQTAFAGGATDGLVSQDATSDITKRQQQALNDQRLKLQADFSNHMYQIRADALQRELQAEEFYHEAALKSDRQYIEAKAAIAERSSVDEIARIQQELAISRQLQGSAGAEVTRARGSSTSKPEEIAAAQRAYNDAAANTRKLEADLFQAESKRFDAFTRRGRDTVLLEKQIAEAVRATKSDEEDYILSLQRQVKEEEARIALIGADQVTQAKANSERKLRNDLQDKLIALDRDIKDLEANNKPVEQIIAKRSEMLKLGIATEDAVARMKELAGIEFNKNQINDLSAAVANALFDGGKEGAQQLRKAVMDVFAKPLKVQLQSALTQIGQDFMEGGSFSQGNFGEGWDNLSNEQQTSLVAAGSTAFATLMDRWMGTGSRGQGYGAAGAQIGSMFGPWGTVIGAIAGSLIGHFTDPDGNANRTAQFGTNPAGNYSFQGRSAFGTFGTFNDQWFSQDDMGQQMRDFMSQESQFENMLAGRMTASERATAATGLAGSHEYSFGTEHGNIQSLADITRDRMAVIVEAVLPGLGQMVTAFQGTGQELETMVQSLFALKDSLTDIDTMIEQLSGNSADAIQAQKQALDRAVESAQSNFAAALESKDPAQVYQAEQQLTSAIMNRYATEMQMVQQLRDAIEQLKEEAYQFQLNVAQRIAAVGGSADVGALALGHAGDIRASLGGENNLAGQARGINSYVGAIDTWYNARRSAIEANMQAEQQAAQAIAGAQQAAAQARIQQLNTELQLAKSFQSVVDATQAMLDDMRLSGSNPASIFARVGMAQADVQTLLAQYHGASGEGRIDAANQLLEALKTYRSLGEEAYQRPSPEWQAIYDEISSDLTDVQTDAKSFAEQSVDIEAKILEAQQQAGVYQAQIAQIGEGSNAELEALNAEALPYYVYAQQEGERIYAAQERHNQEQLDAITGGQDVDLFIAGLQRESRDLLRDVRDGVRQLIVVAGGTPTDGATPGDGSPIGSPGPGDNSNPLDRGTVVIVYPKVSAADVIEAAKTGGSALRRVLENT